MAKKAFMHTISAPIRIFKLVCFWLGFSVIIALSTLTFFVFLFFHSLPNIDELEYSDLKAQAKKVIQESYTIKKEHKWIDIEKVNRDFLYVVVMAEDATFFTHSGINYDAIVEALFQNVKADEIKYGASTISQQVSKNLFLSSQKNIVRKIKEYFITRDIEKRFSKNQILELYINMAEFGPNIYGIEEASKQYFHISANKLNAAQSAFIALMLPSPRKNNYKLFQNQNFSAELKRKYRRIIKDMRFKEYISAKQYKEYLHYNFYKKG